MWDECVKASTLLEKSCRMRYVANVLGGSLTMISLMISQFRYTRPQLRRHKQDRKRVTTAMEDRYLRMRVLRNWSFTFTGLWKYLFVNVRNVKISTVTVRRLLRKAVWQVGLLPLGHRSLQYTKYNNYVSLGITQNWTVQDWKDKLFRGETTVCLWFTDSYDSIWLRYGECYNACNITPMEPVRVLCSGTMFALTPVPLSFLFNGGQWTPHTAWNTYFRIMLWSLPHSQNTIFT